MRDSPLRTMNPDRTIKGKREGIILLNQMSNPFEARVIQSLEQMSSIKRKKQEKKLKKRLTAVFFIKLNPHGSVKFCILYVMVKLR